jgi:hypothetical protein
MTDPDKVKLLFGPYKSPALKLGHRVHCLYRDRFVIVHGWTDARLSWPTCRNAEGRGQPGILVEEVLAFAVRCESALALMHWWGVSSTVVWKWRKALGVERMTPGSARLQRMNADAGAEVLRGVELPPEARERRSRTALEMDLARHTRPCPSPGGAEPWTEAEAKALGSASDGYLAALSGRSRAAVRSARRRRGMRSPDQRRPWTKEEDAVVRTLPPAEAALQTGRTANAVYRRRVVLVLTR